MIDDTQFEAKPKKESTFLNVSIRAWIVLMLVGTVCYMSLLMLEVKEPLYSLVSLAVGYYFGQKKMEGQK